MQLLQEKYLHWYFKKQPKNIFLKFIGEKLNNRLNKFQEKENFKQGVLEGKRIYYDIERRRKIGI
ncbi:MAG: hypothetical protein ACPGSD_17635 [Flavobacteriales bacterium]|jgi:hypothetical protein